MLFTNYKIFNLIYYNSFVEEFTNILVLLYFNYESYKSIMFFISIFIFFCIFCYVLIGLNNLFWVMDKWAIFIGDDFVFMYGRGWGEQPSGLGDNQGGPSNPNPNKRPNIEMEGASTEEDNRRKRSKLPEAKFLRSFTFKDPSTNPSPEIVGVSEAPLGPIKANLSYTVYPTGGMNRYVVFATNDNPDGDVIKTIRLLPEYSRYKLVEIQVRHKKFLGLWFDNIGDQYVRKDILGCPVIDIENGFREIDTIKTRTTHIYTVDRKIAIKGRILDPHLKS